MKFIYAVIYLEPLLGLKTHKDLDFVLQDLQNQYDILENVGVDGVLIENENDRPYSLKANSAAISSMTYVLSKLVRRNKKIKLGLEFLINDPEASLSVAKVTDASFIRTDYFSDRMSREEYGGEIFSDPQGILSWRSQIDANHISIFTDIQVKYAQMINPMSLEESAIKAVNAGSDGIIVTGSETGHAPTTEELAEAKKGCGNKPLIIGSGLSLIHI